MKKMIAWAFLLCAVTLTLQYCNKEELSSGASTSALTALSTATTLTGVAQTSGQLASGTSFEIAGSTDSTVTGTPPGHGNNGHPGGHGPGPLDGTTLLAPTNELLAIIDAESAGDLRGFRMNAAGGATVTNYDASGNTLSFVQPSGGGQGCSLSGGQFPQTDSLLSKIVKTVVDFGTGVTEKHDTVTITRAGKITTTRTINGTTITEETTFDGYSVNGISIGGTKTRVTTTVTSGGTVTSTSATHVAGGKITLTDGSVATWTSDKQRNSSITLSSTKQPDTGTITTEGATAISLTDGTILYSHKITRTLTEEIACKQHHGPVSGTVETIYRGNSITIDFGDGSCQSSVITLTINGVTTTKTVTI